MATPGSAQEAAGSKDRVPHSKRVHGAGGRGVPFPVPSAEPLVRRVLPRSPAVQQQRQASPIRPSSRSMGQASEPAASCCQRRGWWLPEITFCLVDPAKQTDCLCASHTCLPEKGICGQTGDE
jgi:hypothetical protein